MMTHELEVSILAAPLGAIDRRALSQAWYSALHLAAPARQVAGTGIAQRRSPIPPLPYDTQTAPGAAVANADRRSRRRLRLVGRTYRGEAPALRQSPQTRLAARIERAFGAASSPKRATFSFGPRNARVHVVLQTTPTRTTLVALCRPELRGSVGEALAQARSALAARGIALDVRKIGGRACF